MPMPDSLPDRDIALDLDALDLERSAPFKFAVAGRVIEMIDASDLDWKIGVNLSRPGDVIRNCVSKEDQQFLAAQNISGKKFNKLIEAYALHFGLGTSGNAAG